MSTYRELPDHTRVWVYQSNRELTDSEVIDMRNRSAVFAGQWAAHGSRLRAAIEVFYNRFLVVFVDEDQAEASGCSIDSSVQFVRDLEVSHNISLMDRMLLAYKQGDEIKVEKMADFEQLMEHGNITEQTIVFNNLVSTKADFESSWEVQLKDSWHARMLAS
jgi:hypothetical protein